MEKDYGSVDEGGIHADVDSEFTVIYCRCGYTAASSFHKAMMGGYWTCPECRTGYALPLIFNRRQLIRTENQDMKYMRDGDKNMSKHRRIAKYYEFAAVDTQDEIGDALRLMKEIGATAFIHEITEGIKLWAKNSDAKPEKNLTDEQSFA